MAFVCITGDTQALRIVAGEEQMRPDGIAAPSRRAGSGRRVWTVEAVRALDTVTDVPTARQILGMGRTKAYQLVRSQSFPVPILKTGRRYVVPVQGLPQAIG
jgi:hypothetical protein